MISLSVSIQYRRVTDRQTDRHATTAIASLTDCLAQIVSTIQDSANTVSMQTCTEKSLERIPSPFGALSNYGISKTQDSFVLRINVPLSSPVRLLLQKLFWFQMKVTKSFVLPLRCRWRQPDRKPFNNHHPLTSSNRRRIVVCKIKVYSLLYINRVECPYRRLEFRVSLRDLQDSWNCSYLFNFIMYNNFSRGRLKCSWTEISGKLFGDRKHCRILSVLSSNSQRNRCYKQFVPHTRTARH